MVAQKFGSRHTDEKLDKLERYLKSYSTALKNQNFHLIFFDAFAGTGDIQIGEEAPLLQNVDEYEPFIKGSAQRALRFGEAFDQYIFVEKSKKKVRELRELLTLFPDMAQRINIRCGDANEQLKTFCAQTDWRSSRAVVFLDPCGNQVEWETIAAIAKTEAIDLWYLFPAGLGVYRQISKTRGVHKTHVDSLDKLFGTTKWRDAFITLRETDDLFGSRENQEKEATVESVTRYMAMRMKRVFKGGVLEEWLPLGSKGIHMYSLMFAWANPSEKAQLAGKLALAVLRSGNRGRFK